MEIFMIYYMCEWPCIEHTVPILNHQKEKTKTKKKHTQRRKKQAKSRASKSEYEIWVDIGLAYRNYSIEITVTSRTKLLTNFDRKKLMIDKVPT